MAQKVTTSGTASTTDYIGEVEEQTDSTLTKYYALSACLSRRLTSAA